MNTKKPTDKPIERRPDDSIDQRQGPYDPARPGSPGQSEASEGRKDVGKPEGRSPGKPASKPGERGPGQDGRSDRDAGRPVQLDDRREDESALR